MRSLSWLRVSRSPALRGALCCVALLGNACAYNAYSPPARALPLESAATLPLGRFALAGDIGWGYSIFGPNLIAAGVRARRGVAEGLDVTAEANFARIAGHAHEDTREHRNLYAARIGMKFQPLSFLALSFGVGAGASAAGGFASPDLGAIAAWENDFIVPFLSVRGFVSQPIAAREVDLGVDDGKHVLDTPTLSYGVAAVGGVRIPLTHGRAVSPSVLAGVTAFEIFDRQHQEAYFCPSLSFEAGF